MKYVKEIEVYRLGEGKPPEWVQKALDFKDIEFKKQDMIDMDEIKVYKQAIVGITDGVNDYDIDSYIIRDKNRGVYIMSETDFEQSGFKLVD